MAWRSGGKRPMDITLGRFRQHRSVLVLAAVAQQIVVVVGAILSWSFLDQSPGFDSFAAHGWAAVFAGGAVTYAMLRQSRRRLTTADAALFRYETTLRCGQAIINGSPAHRVDASLANVADSGVFWLERVERIATAMAGGDRLTRIDAVFSLWLVVGVVLVSPIMGIVLVIASVTFLMWASDSRSVILKRLDRAACAQRRRSRVLQESHSIADASSGSRGARTWRVKVEEIVRSTNQEVFQAIVSMGRERAVVWSYVAGTGIAIALIGAQSFLVGNLSVGALLFVLALGSLLIHDLAIYGMGELHRANLSRDCNALLPMLESSTDIGRAPVVRQRGVAGHVTFRNVEVHRVPGTTIGGCLERLTLNIEPGEIVGIRARDGCSREVLFALLRGALRPDRGEVRIDSLDPASPEGRPVRGMTRFVPREVRLFSGTILENIFAGDARQGRELARATARCIGLDSLVCRLPDGYDTQISGTRDSDLPPGLCQGIAVARAVARRPSLLLLDDVTSAMDGTSDALALAGLRSLRGLVTMIVTSNRPDTLRMADRAFDFQGSHLFPISPDAFSRWLAQSQLAEEGEALSA